MNQDRIILAVSKYSVPGRFDSFINTDWRDKAAQAGDAKRYAASF